MSMQSDELQFNCESVVRCQRFKRTWLKALFTQDAKADLHANLCANPLILLATCVNTPIDHSVSHNLLTPVARCSASCVNGVQDSCQPPGCLTFRAGHILATGDSNTKQSRLIQKETGLDCPAYWLNFRHRCSQPGRLPVSGTPGRNSAASTLSALVGRRSDPLTPLHT